MVYSYNDPMKREDRFRLRSFLDKNLFRYKDRSRIRGVAFLGAENDQEIALEWDEVYAPLGLHKSQVYSIEYGAKQAKRQRDAGFTVIEKEDVEVFRTLNEQLDFAHLDYTSPQTDVRLESLALLIGRHLLNSRSVLCTKYAGKRESE